LVRVDGRVVSEYNLAWLRSQIGLVSQEPLLFSTSIADNIRFVQLQIPIISSLGIAFWMKAWV
jgi:ABC-type multidrug transport system fused ATPase/permease subunit